MFKRASWLAAVALAIAAAGCSGSDGAQGPAGAQGPQGPQGPAGTQGPAGPVTLTEESCMVCHATDRIAPVAPAHALPFATGLKPNTNITVTNVATDVAGHVIVDFTAMDPGPIGTIDGSEVQVVVAGYDPVTVTTGGKGWFNRWLREQPTGSVLPGTLANLGSGSYEYTTKGTMSSAPAVTTTQRVFLQIGKAGHNYGNGFYDFNKSDWTAGTATASFAAATTDQRDIVPTAVCNQCHVDRIGDYGHTAGPTSYMAGSGARTDTRACVICHNPITGPTYPADRADFPSFIHQIHGGIKGPKFDWSAVTFPADMKNCTFCHQGGADSDRYETNPNKQACSSCHTTVDFVSHHGFGTVTDTACVGCHGVGAQYAVAKMHSMNPNPGDPTYDVSLAPEYVVSMSITPPANNSYYVANEAPVVTIQFLQNGTLMPASFYGQAKDKAGVQNDQLTTASLYVYGPRTKPVPVLTTGAAKTPVPTQGQALFIPSADPLVATTTAGAGAFAYKLKAIPSTMTPGTYMVRFYAADYGYVSDTNFRISSNAFQNIQILTAAVTPKVDGDCTRCHGSGNLPGHNMRHAVVFNTDQCVSCHDLSGNYATPIANRVHSVHSGSKLGDLADIDWSTTTSLTLANGTVAGPITYPVGDLNGGIKNCAVCHSSGNPQYTQNVASFSCRGCHADDPATLGHIQQMGGK